MNAAAKTVTSIAPSKSVSERVEKLDWERVWQELDAQGGVMIGRLLSPDESQSLAALYPKDDIFRSRVVMARHGFGGFSCAVPPGALLLRSLFPVGLKKDRFWLIRQTSGRWWISAYGSWTAQAAISVRFLCSAFRPFRAGAM
jgi:hypothetical protein